MVDVVTIPKRLEDTVGKTQRHYVLNRFLAEEMVNSEHLALVGDFQDAGIEFFRRYEIVAEGLFDDDTTESAVFLMQEPSRRQSVDDGTKEAVGHGEVENAVGILGFSMKLIEAFLQLVEGFVTSKIALLVMQAIPQPVPSGLIEIVGM